MANVKDFTVGQWVCNLNDPVSRVYTVADIYPDRQTSRGGLIHARTPLNNLYGGILYGDTLQAAPPELVKRVQAAVAELRADPRITTRRPVRYEYKEVGTGAQAYRYKKERPTYQAEYDKWLKDYVAAERAAKQKHGLYEYLHFGGYYDATHA